ncbi:MAG TPA: hypothetical protein VFD70_27890 [Anaerolineae bacterium]|nr:hypothetical protein [Anaerolineae bacterium]
MTTYNITISLKFLAFLALATLSAGVAYPNALILLGGHGDWSNVLLLLVSVPLFGFTMLVLARILYLTAPKHNRAEAPK